MSGLRRISIVLGALAFAAQPAFALGLGEYALTARAGDTRMDETRVLDHPEGQYDHSVTCGTVTVWVSSYSIQDTIDWENNGWAVNLEYLDYQGERHIICNLL